MTKRISAFARTLVTALGLLVFLYGCGGSGGGTSGGGGAISVDQRMAVLDLIGQKINSLPNLDRDADSLEILGFLQGRPEFKSAGLTAGGDVWGEFVDGQMYLAINNRTPGITRSSRTSVTRVAPVVELPSTASALLLFAFGQGLTPPIDDIGGWLTGGGYTVALNHEVGVEDLKNVDGRHGIFYIDAHGSVFPRPVGTSSVDSFGLTTSTNVTHASLIAYAQDLEKVRLAFGHVRLTEEGRSVGVAVKLKFVITDLFVKHYNWRFAKNSFVFINACESYNAPFRNACFAAGASCYAGWTKPVEDAAAYSTAKFVFDQLLGANKFVAFIPKQRPFDWQSLYDEMKRDGFDDLPGAKGRTKFVFAQNPSDDTSSFAILAPTISRLDMSGQNTLTIHGLFGKNGDGKGQVTVGGTPVTGLAWSADRIVCDLSALSPSLHGDVVVTVAGHKSNVVQLTMWEGKFQMTESHEGSLETHGDFTFRIRGDVHEARFAPNSAPVTAPIQFFKEAQDSKCTVGASGSLDDPEQTWQLNGSPNLPIEVGNQPDQPNFKYSGSIDPAAHTIHFTFSVRGVDKGRIISPNADDLLFPIFFLHSSFRDALDNTGAIPLTMNGDFSLQAGSLSDPNFGTPITLTWSAIPAQSPPKSDAARSARPRTR